MLSCIRVCRQHQSDALRTRKVCSVDYGEKHHYMVVYGKPYWLVIASHLLRGVVRHIVYDEKPKTSDRLKDLGFDLPVEEPRVFDWNLKVWTLIVRWTFATRNLLASKVFYEADLSEHLILRDLIPTCKVLRKLVIAFDVKASKMLDDLTRQVLRPQAGDYTKLMRFDDAHKALLGGSLRQKPKAPL